MIAPIILPFFSYQHGDKDRSQYYENVGDLKTHRYQARQGLGLRVRVAGVVPLSVTPNDWA